MAFTSRIKKFFERMKKEERKRKLKSCLDNDDLPINKCNLYEIYKNE